MDNKNIYKVKRVFAEGIAEKLKLLLEEKHLYQSVHLSEKSLKQVIQDTINNVDDDFPESEEIVRLLLESNWTIDNPTGMGGTVIGPSLNSLQFKIVNIKTTCGNCGETSPMNLKTALDTIDVFNKKSSFSPSQDHNVFSFSFQCQNCREGIEVFYIARKRNKLTLVGRSPMEQVQVPADIPNDFKKYYSGAIIAFNSGQVLPALFMLRTLIEQFTRDVTENFSGLADEVLTDYMESLPNDFKSRFPSLKEIYSNLSDAIHEADESEELFLESRKEIEDHFEAKRIFQTYSKN